MAAIIRPVCSGAWVAAPGRLKNSGHILDRGAPPSPNLRGHARRGVETTVTDGRSFDECLQWLYDGSRTKTKALDARRQLAVLRHLANKRIPLRQPQKTWKWCVSGVWH